MGNRRIGRKRLYAVEKAGQLINLESGAGIAKAIKSATQHRNGQEIITEIQVDLEGPSGTDILGGGTNKSIGEASGKTYLTQLTEAKFGIITEIRAVLVEALATQADVDVRVGPDIEAKGEAVGGSGATVVVDGLADLGEDITNSNPLPAALQTSSSEMYLYLTNGDSDTNAVAITGGKVLIYIHGFAAPADL